jgi:MFS family permease
VIPGHAAFQPNTSADRPVVPLSRNRDYRLLWGSQALSQFGGNAAGIAFPLLVLAITNSPAMVGLVLGTSAAASLLVGLPAGALVDRWDRKKVMLSCVVVDVMVTASLIIALWFGAAGVGHLIMVAAVWGMCAAMFGSAENACLPAIVPDEHLSTAVSLNAGRGDLAHLLGTAVGGFLFAIERFVPFLMDALTRVVSFFTLLFVRVPARNVQPEPISRLGREIVTGIRWVSQQRMIRVIGLLAVGINMFLAAYFVIIIVLARGRGVQPGEIGVMVALTGLGGVIGSLVAPYLYRRLTPYFCIIAVLWAITLLAPIVIFISNGYLMGALFGMMMFLAPTANTTVDTCLLLFTPDELRGRMGSVMGVFIGSAGIAGPALGGFLVEAIHGNHAVLLCAVGIGIVTVLGTISPTLRKYPHRTAVVGSFLTDPKAQAADRRI